MYVDFPGLDFFSSPKNDKTAPLISTYFFSSVELFFGFGAQTGNHRILWPKSKKRTGISMGVLFSFTKKLWVSEFFHPKNLRSTEISAPRRVVAFWRWICLAMVTRRRVIHPGWRTATSWKRLKIRWVEEILHQLIDGKHPIFSRVWIWLKS